MRHKTLGPSHEIWIEENFGKKPLKVLVHELSEIVRADYQLELEELNLLLPRLSTKAAVKSIISRINFLSSFTCVSESIIKRVAKEHKCKKSGKYISSTNSKNCMSGHFKRWREAAVEVTSPLNWFRTFEPKNTYVAFMRKGRKISFQNSVSNWNNGEGVQKRLFILATYYTEQELIVIKTHSKTDD